MLNSFLLSKHFEFNSDDSASSLYKKSKNSFEKTVKNAIGLSNFISSFGQIISSKLLNSNELASIKAEPRKTKDVNVEKKSISFELYQVPSKNKTNISLEGIPIINDDRTLKSGTTIESKATLDTGLKASDNQKEDTSDDLPSVKDLMKERQKQIKIDEKRFSHKKISYKISDEEKRQDETQSEMDVNTQSPQEMEEVDQNGNISINTDDDPIDTETQTNLNELGAVKSVVNHDNLDQSHLHDSHDNESHNHESHLHESHHDKSHLHESHVNDSQMIESQSQMNDEDDMLNPSHFNLNESSKSHGDVLQNDIETIDSEENSDHNKSQHLHEVSDMQDETMEEKIHIDKPSHLIDVEEGDYDKNDPLEIQELDKEEARLKRLEKLGYPKVEKIDLEVKKSTNSYGLHSMSLTSSVKKFDGNPEAGNAYKTLNVVMSKPFQEIKQEYQTTQQNVEQTDPKDIEMVDPQTHINTYGSFSDPNESDRKERRLRVVSQEPSYDQMKLNYINQLRLNKERNLRQVQMNMIPYVPLKRNYSDKDMFRKKSFLSQKELNKKITRRAPVPRNLLDNVSGSRHRHHYKNLKQKTDEMYDNMLKMRF